jgi:hypothetical protein
MALGIFSKFTSTGRNCQVTHYEAGLDFWPRSNRLTCRVHISIIAISPSDSYSFLLGEKYQLENVSYLGIPVKTSLRSSGKGLKSIAIRLPRKSTPGEKFTLLFVYSGPLPWYPGQASNWELAPQDYWYPFIASEQSYTARLRITTPEPVKICASGRETGSNRQDTRYRTSWTMETPGKGLHVVAGDYYRAQRESGPVTILYPRAWMNQAKVLQNHWDKLAELLPSFCPPLETPASYLIITSQEEVRHDSSRYITCLSSGLLEEVKQIGSVQARSQRLFVILARQLAQRTLKARLPVANPAHAWYLEGLAQYAAWSMAENLSGKKVKDQLLLEARELALSAPKPLVDSGSELSLDFPTWVAARGAWLMQMVHSLIQDKFFPGIQELLGGDGYIQEPSDFFAALGKYAGVDLLSLYREMATTTNNLAAQVEDARYFTDGSGQWQLVFTLSNRGRLRWPHPVEVVIKLNDGSLQTHRLPLQKEPHLLITPLQVTDIFVDPQLTLLNQGSVHNKL